MHIKRMHEMVEKLTECTKSAIENDEVCVGQYPIGDVVDMIKDLCCAEKDAFIAKAMQKEEEEGKEEEKYLLKRLKEDYKDEYKEMQEQYGDDADRRFYDSWRHADGTFARKGTGGYRPRSYYRRRGYAEPPYFRVMPDMYEDYRAEEMRDIDRGRGRMYFADGINSGSGNSGGSYSGNSGSGSSGNMGGNSSGSYRGSSGGNNVRGYSDGYSDGYSEGERNGRKSGSNSRYDRAKRGYEEVKQAHNGNTPEDKQITMKEAEKMLNVVFDEIDEMLEDASPEMKNMVRTKGMSRFQKIQ